MTTLKQADAVSLVYPRSARLAVATIFLVNGAVIANWIARIPDVKQSLGLTEGTLGFVLLFMAAGALVAQPTAGWLIGRVGSRSITALMAIAFCLTIVLPGWATSVPLLMLALFILGACNGGLDVAMNAQAALVEQQYGRPIMSSFHGLWSVGGLAGAAIGGLAAARGIELGAHFLVVAVVAVAIVAIATRWLVADAGAGGSHEPSFALPPRALLLMGVIAFCALFSEGAIGDWSAVYLRDTLGSDAGLAASGYAVFALLMAIGRLTGDWLTLRLGPTLLVRGGGALVTLGVALALLGGSPIAAIVGFGLVGAGISCVFPLILSAASRTPGVPPGTGIAAMATVGYTGFLVGPPLIGTAAEALSLRGALGLLGLFGVLMVVFGSAVKRAEQG